MIAWLASISAADWCLIGVVGVLLYVTACDAISARRERLQRSEQCQGIQALQRVWLSEAAELEATAAAGRWDHCFDASWDGVSRVAPWLDASARVAPARRGDDQ